MSTDHLNQLLQILTSNVQAVQAIYSEYGFPGVPQLSDTTSPPPPKDPRLIQVTSLIVSAASQLIASVQNPAMFVMETAGSMYAAATLGLAVEANVVEILREAGPQVTSRRSLMKLSLRTII
jgi:hypothetical protein